MSGLTGRQPARYSLTGGRLSPIKFRGWILQRPGNLEPLDDLAAQVNQPDSCRLTSTFADIQLLERGDDGYVVAVTIPSSL